MDEIRWPSGQSSPAEAGWQATRGERACGPVDLQRAHRVGRTCPGRCATSSPPRPAAQRAARRGGRGAGLGERRPLLLRQRLGDRALDPARRLGHLAEPARVGEQRPDDVLLLRRRARGAARVRCRRAARAPPPRAAGARGARRHGGADRDLPRLQRRRRRGRRLGGGDVDRHRIRAWGCWRWSGRASRPPARLHADDHRRRRRGGAAWSSASPTAAKWSWDRCSSPPTSLPSSCSPWRCESGRASSTSCSPRSPGWRCSIRRRAGGARARGGA